MPRILLSFITCIFLFGAYSAKGQTAEKDGPLEQALRWERVVYSSDDPDAVNDALYSKASCYEGASMYDEAFRTLERIRMYLLPPEKVPEVLLFKSRCCMKTGEMGAALSFLEESGRAGEHPAMYSVLLASAWRFDESEEWATKCVPDDARKDAVRKLFNKAPVKKTEGKAAALSFLPPAGQIYVKKPWEGMGSLLMNACAVGFTAFELLDKSWVTGFLGGGLLLNETFMKWNLESNVSMVDEVNKCSIEDFCKQLESIIFDNN